MAFPGTAVILLNWNGAEDSIACIQSLLQMRDQDFVVVLCDNNSTDGSFETLRSWGTAALGETFVTWEPGQQPAHEARVVLIQTGANLGFAGGCNVGIRYVLLLPSVQYLWLLNNDTIVDENALGAQLQKLQGRPEIGILGSTLIFFSEPGLVQAPGGYDFNFWTSRVIQPFGTLHVDNLPSEISVEARLKYISGASMLVRRSFIEEVGLLNEQYFLYFEEVDWATRGKGRFRLGYCSSSRVVHKEGRSIGSHRQVEQRSSFSERLLARNRVLFLRTYFPYRLLVCLIWIFAVGVVRLVKGHMTPAVDLWRGAWDGLFAPIHRLPRLDQWPTKRGL